MNHRLDRSGEFAMRTQDPSNPTPHADASSARFDRVWAATRPSDPSPATLDALWAHASVELDRIAASRESGQVETRVIPFANRSTRRRRIVAGIILAQAAAILAAV